MKLTRRELLKQGILINVLSAIAGFDIELFKQNIDKFTLKQLEALKQVVSLDIVESSPYWAFWTGSLTGYIITFTNGQDIIYMDYEKVEEIYGDIFIYYSITRKQHERPEYSGVGWLL